MKKHLLVRTSVISLFCLTGCQLNEHENKNENHPIVEKEKQSENKPVKEPVLPKNDAFIITSVAMKQDVEHVIEIEGKARVFEATFLYRLEDGQSVLAEGYSMTDMGAPEWGDFKLSIHYTQPSTKNGILTIYEASAKDGNPEHVLKIPIDFSHSNITE